jgi:hypothetical protein
VSSFGNDVITVIVSAAADVASAAADRVRNAMTHTASDRRGAELGRQDMFTSGGELRDRDRAPRWPAL